MSAFKKPFLLLILDGFGIRQEKNYNAIANASMPVFNALWKDSPHTLLNSSGEAVGLPVGQMGNSEVGHLNIGAGRIVYQELTRIDKAIENKNFFKNTVLLEALNKAQQRGANIHLMGLLSPGGVHSHENHFIALIKLLKNYNFNNFNTESVYIHAFLDGRDTPPKSALFSLEKIENTGAKIASLMGRFYAMDRDKRFERTAQAFDLLTQGKADYSADSAQQALLQAYSRGETDEFVKPVFIKHNFSPIKPDDLIIFMNFRADRARQLTRVFSNHDYHYFISLTKYADDLDIPVIFPPQSLKNVLSEYLSDTGLKQLHIAETEKYAHVTFFFNGGREAAYKNETRLLIPSPKVQTYDLAPAMSAIELTDKLTQAIESQEYDFIVCNYANPDMVGHTGNYKAAVQALEIIDQCIEKIILALKKSGGEMILTADHGNAECMFDEKTGQAHTAHTCDPVPFIYVGRPAKILNTQSNTAILSDIAPTILYLMGLAVPSEMTGKKLLELEL